MNFMATRMGGFVRSFKLSSLRYTITLQKRVDEGYMLPKGYGLAWEDYATGSAICYPIPLNILLSWCRVVFIWALMCRKTRSILRDFRNIEAAYDRGYQDALFDVQIRDQLRNRWIDENS